LWNKTLSTNNKQQKSKPLGFCYISPKQPKTSASTLTLSPYQQENEAEVVTAGGGGDIGCDDGNKILKGGNKVNSSGV
jgi:hypothetical protein